MRSSNAIGLAVLGFAILAGAAIVLDVGGVQQKLFLESAPPRQAVIAKLPEPKAPEPSRAGPPAEITPAWFVNSSGLDGAELERQATRAPMVVYLQSRDCDGCRKFERDVLAAAPVKTFFAGVVKVRIDVKAGDREQKVAQRFGALRLPAVWVVPQRGPGHLVPLQRGSAFLSPSELVGFLR
jgi:hypothetical protein